MTFLIQETKHLLNISQTTMLWCCRAETNCGKNADFVELVEMVEKI